MHIDLRLAQRLGLSLNDKTRYHLVYDECAGVLVGVYDDLDLAIGGMRGSVAEYDARCTPESNRDTVGCVRHYGKGLMQNQSVWEVLAQMRIAVLEDLESAGARLREDAGEGRSDPKAQNGPVMWHNWRAPAAVDRYIRAHPAEHSEALGMLDSSISCRIQTPLYPPSLELEPLAPAVEDTA